MRGRVAQRHEDLEVARVRILQRQRLQARVVLCLGERHDPKHVRGPRAARRPNSRLAARGELAVCEIPDVLARVAARKLDADELFQAARKVLRPKLDQCVEGACRENQQRFKRNLLSRDAIPECLGDGKSYAPFLT